METIPQGEVPWGLPTWLASTWSSRALARGKRLAALFQNLLQITMITMLTMQDAKGVGERLSRGGRLLKGFIELGSIEEGLTSGVESASHDLHTSPTWPATSTGGERLATQLFYATRVFTAPAWPTWKLVLGAGNYTVLLRLLVQPVRQGHL